MIRPDRHKVKPVVHYGIISSEYSGPRRPETEHGAKNRAVFCVEKEIAGFLDDSGQWGGLRLP